MAILVSGRRDSVSKLGVIVVGERNYVQHGEGNFRRYKVVEPLTAHPCSHGTISPAFTEGERPVALSEAVPELTKLALDPVKLGRLRFSKQQGASISFTGSITVLTKSNTMDLS